MSKLIIDSGSDYSLIEAKENGYTIVPMQIECNGKTYRDRYELDPDSFYDLLETSSQLPKTSQPSPGAFLDEYEKIDEEIVVIPIAKELSGTYQSALLAKEMSGRQDIEVVDSMQVTLSLRMMIEEALKWQKEGKSAKEIKTKLEELRNRIHLVAVVDTLDYLYKGGRLSKTAYMAGNFLKIKPIIGVENGEVCVFSKARGKKSVLVEVLKQMENKDIDLDFAYFGYSGKEHDIQPFVDAILEKYPFKKYEIVQIGAAIGTHAGPGAMAVVFKEN